MIEYDPPIALAAAREALQATPEGVSQAIAGMAGEAALSQVAALDLEQIERNNRAYEEEAARCESRKIEAMGRVNAALLTSVAHGIRDRIGLKFRGLETEEYNDWLAHRTHTTFVRPPGGTDFARTEYSKTDQPDYLANSWSARQRPVPLWIVGEMRAAKANRYIALAPYCADMRICIDGSGGIRGGVNDAFSVYYVETKPRRPLAPTPVLPSDEEIQAAYDPAKRTFRFEQARVLPNRSMPRVQQITKIKGLSDGEIQDFNVAYGLTRLVADFNASDALDMATAAYTASRQKVNDWNGR